jgi:transketolase
VRLTGHHSGITPGFGGAVAEVLADAGAGVPLHRPGIRDEYGLSGGPPTHEAKALLE